MSKIDEAILALGHIKPPLSVRGIALRVRTTGAHVEQVLQEAGLLEGRPLLDQARSVSSIPHTKDVAVLQASADLVARGYRVYLPVNKLPASGKTVDLLAMHMKHTDVLRIVVGMGEVDAAGQLCRTKPHRNTGVVLAMIMPEGITYDPGLPDWDGE